MPGEYRNILRITCRLPKYKIKKPIIVIKVVSFKDVRQLMFDQLEYMILSSGPRSLKSDNLIV
jgi:hypothetical protein